MSEEYYKELDKIILKYQLLDLDITQIEKLYKDKILYDLFLNVTNRIACEEPQFFLIDSNIKDKILTFINKKRFLDEYKDLNESINQTIININIVTSCLNKDNIIKNYIKEQLQLRFEDKNVYRELIFQFGSDFINLGSILITQLEVYDYIYYLKLQAKRLQSIDINEEPQFLSSTNYLVTKIPELFIGEVKVEINETLNNIETEPIKKLVKTTKKNLMRL